MLHSPTSLHFKILKCTALRKQLTSQTHNDLLTKHFCPFSFTFKSTMLTDFKTHLAHFMGGKTIKSNEFSSKIVKMLHR